MTVNSAAVDGLSSLASNIWFIFFLLLFFVLGWAYGAFFYKNKGDNK